MKRKNLYRNLIIILICIFVPIMIAIGAASWYMISESSIKPKYNPNSAFYLYLNNQTTTYNGAAQLPKSTNDNVSFDKDTISFICYKKNSEGKFVEYEHDTPIDAGDYLLRYSDSDDESNGGYAGSDVLFKINKATPIFNSIEVIYDQFEEKSYFSTEMNTSKITYSSSFEFYNKSADQFVTVEGTAKYTDSNPLSVGDLPYAYTFYPDDSNNFNSVSNSINIVTYAKVEFLNDDLNANNIIETDYVAKGTSLTYFSPDPGGLYSDEIETENSFLGWLDDNKNIFDFSSLIETNLTLTASWNYKTHTINLYNINGDNSPTPQVVSYKINELPKNVENPNLEIKYFKRWKLNDNNGPESINITLDNYQDFSGNNYTAYFYDIILIDVIEINYSTQNRTFANFKTEVLSSTSIKLADSAIENNEFRSCIDFDYIHNGYYYYGNSASLPNNLKGTLQTTTNIAGSTYIASFYIKDSGTLFPYEYVIKYTNPDTGEIQYFEKNDKCDGVIKYKTALIGSTLYTIEDAIDTANKSASSSNNVIISLSGNTNNFVETCFSNIDFEEEYHHFGLFNSYLPIITINSYIKLLVPFNNSTNEVATGSNSGNIVYSVLKILNYTTLNFESNSSLVIGAEITYVQPKTTIVNARGVVMNYGTLNFQSASTLLAYGFLKGGVDNENKQIGEINFHNGSSVTECMTTYDFPGGTTTTAILNKAFPTNAWTIHNISCFSRIFSGCTYNAYAYILDQVAYATIISSGSNSLFKPVNINESTYIEKYSIPARTSDIDSDALYTEQGSNQLNGQRDIIKMHGEYTDNTFSIEIEGNGFSSSPSVALPLGFMDVILASGCKLSLNNASYLFMPGSISTIEENAQLTIKTGLNITFADYTNHIASPNANDSKTDYTYKTYCIDTNPAKLIVNGTITCNGNIGGYITTESTNAKLIFNSATLQSGYESLFSGYGAREGRNYVTYKVTGFHAYGPIYNGTSLATTNFTKATYTGAIFNNEFCWRGTQGTVTSGFYGTVSKATQTCITGDTLITLANGTKKMVKDLLPTDLLLVFNHETGKYEFAPMIFNDVEPEGIYRIVNLKFSDGTIVKVVYEHGFFDTTLNKYVYIREDNMNEFIGHKFYQGNYDGTIYTSNEVTLVDAYVTEELTTVYSPVTVYHLNYFTEDMLSMPAGIPGLFNIFEYGDNLTFDKEQMQADIDKYGLYTYDDFKDYISYEVYSMFPAPYLKVAVGKGLTTYEDIIEMIYLYLEKHDLMK